MRRPFSGGLWKRLGDAWFIGTTREGKVLAVSILLTASVASASLDIPVFYLLCGLSALAAASFVTAQLYRPRVALRGEVPEKAVAGELVAVTFSLVNTGRRTAYDVTADFPLLPEGVEMLEESRLLPVLGPGESGAVSTTLRVLRRGLYVMPEARAYSTFPMNLYRVRARRAKKAARTHRLVAYPRFHPLTGIDVPVSARYQPGGIALSSHVGESPEYVGNRPYRPGDSPRHMDFRAWARLAAPVVREYHEEYYCRIALVLDTFVPGRRWSKRKEWANLEAAVSMAAAVADALAQGEYIIDVFAAGPSLHVFRMGRHTAHFDSVLEILACVDACRTNPFDVVTPALADELTSISTVVCVLLDWDESREALVRVAAECGCSVKVAIIREGETTQPFDHVADLYRISVCAPRSVTDGMVENL